VKLSGPMIQVLKNLAAGLSAGNHCRTMSDHGGVTRVMYALRRRGLIDLNSNLTDAGREAAQAKGVAA